jgi:hypothetical protein
MFVVHKFHFIVFPSASPDVEVHVHVQVHVQVQVQVQVHHAINELPL